MPLYEYKCKQCEKTFEVLQKIDASPLDKCIYCNGKVEKLISVSSFQFKGAGWYITDYKNKNTTSDDNGKRTKTSVGKAEAGQNNNATIK
jgi:putative FmdB family regulatory protein